MPRPVAMETAGPPVDRVAVDDWGEDVFVGEGGGESPWFVSMGDLEDQSLMAAVVIVVDLILEDLRGSKREFRRVVNQMNLLVPWLILNRKLWLF